MSRSLANVDAVIVVGLGASRVALAARAIEEVALASEAQDAVTLAAALGSEHVDQAGARLVLRVRTVFGTLNIAVGGKPEIVPLGASAWMALPSLFETAQNGAYAALVRLDAAGTSFAVAIDPEQIAMEYPEAVQ